MNTAIKRVKYAGDTSCFELLDGFNGKYATDGEIVVNVESMDVCRPRIVNGKPYYRLVKPDGKKCERSLHSLMHGLYTRDCRCIDIVSRHDFTIESVSKIASREDVDQSTLAAYIRRHGIPHRTREEINSQRHAEAVERWGREHRPRNERRAKWWCENTGAEFDPRLDLDSLLERNGYMCNACGKQTTKDDLRWGNFGPDYPTLDHIVRLSEGGSHTFDNAQVLCGYCNCIIKG